MPKYQQVFQQMMDQNKNLFDEFKTIHDNYSINPKKYQSEFDQIGYDVQDVIRRYENILCGKSENTGFSKFSSNLAEKFHQLIKKHFPKIDFIGAQTN